MPGMWEGGNCSPSCFMPSPTIPLKLYCPSLFLLMALFSLIFAGSFRFPHFIAQAITTNECLSRQSAMDCLVQCTSTFLGSPLEPVAPVNPLPMEPSLSQPFLEPDQPLPPVIPSHPKPYPRPNSIPYPDSDPSLLQQPFPPTGDIFPPARLTAPSNQPTEPHVHELPPKAQLPSVAQQSNPNDLNRFFSPGVPTQAAPPSPPTSSEKNIMIWAGIIPASKFAEIGVTACEIALLVF